MKTRMTFLIVVFLFLWIIAVLGGAGAILSVVFAEIGDGDVYNGLVHDVHRNSSFFNSSDQTINSILVIPQYFFKTYSGQWGWGNMFLGFLGFLSLLLVFPSPVYFEDRKLSAFIFGVFGFLYTSYWAFTTIFVVINLISGERLTEVYTWG